MTSIAAPQPLSRSWPSRLAFMASVLIVLIFSNGWQLFVLGPDADADPDGSILARVIYLPAYAAALGLLITAPGASARAALRAPLLWLLVIIAFASAYWSLDPGVTTRRSVALLFTTAGALAIAARYDWPDLAEVLATAFGVLAIASLMTGLFAPSLGRMTDIFPGAWRGVWTEKNALGDHMALGVVIFLAATGLNPRRRWLWLGGAGLALLLVLLSTSKTSVVGLVFGLAAFGLVFVVRRGPASAVIATFAAVVGILAAISVALFASDLVLGALGKDATLTGRTNIWGPVIREAQTRPWTGFGYGAVWDDKSNWGPLAWISKQAQFVPRAAHDSWLDVWLGLGYVGLAVWSLYFAETWLRAIWALYRNAGAYLVLPLLVIYSLTTITESAVLNYNDFTWVIFVVMAVGLTIPPRTARG